MKRSAPGQFDPPGPIAMPRRCHQQHRHQQEMRDTPDAKSLRVRAAQQDRLRVQEQVKHECARQSQAQGLHAPARVFVGVSVELFEKHQGHDGEHH